MAPANPSIGAHHDSKAYPQVPQHFGIRRQDIREYHVTEGNGGGDGVKERAPQRSVPGAQQSVLYRRHSERHPSGRSYAPEEHVSLPFLQPVPRRNQGQEG